MTSAGAQMHALVERLYPLCRSITGDGVRETLRAVAARVPLEVHEVASGTEGVDITPPLADALAHSRSRVTHTVTRMEKAGLVKRSRGRMTRTSYSRFPSV